MAYEELLPLLNKNIKRRSPDGTIEYHDDLASFAKMMAAENGGSGSQSSGKVRGIVDTISKPVGKAVGAASRAIGGFSEGLRKDPTKAAGFSRLLGDIGSSIAATNPQSWQYQLGRKASESAAGVQAEALRSGKTLEGIAGYGISPQERAALASEALQGREVGVKERNLDLQREIADRDFEIQLRKTGISQQEADAYMERINKIPPYERQFEQDRILARIRSNKGYVPTSYQEGTDVVTASFNRNTGKFEVQARGPLVETLGLSGAQNAIDRYKPLTPKERETSEQSVATEANRLIKDIGGAKEPGFLKGGGWEANDLLRYGQDNSNPFDKAKQLDKWAAFEAGRPFMEQLVLINDLRDKKDVTDEEAMRILNVDNKIKFLRTMTPADRRGYIALIKKGMSADEALKVFEEYKQTGAK